MYNSIDLFCGCGGLSQGLVNAGFRVLLANDINSDAIKAYKLNHKKTVTLLEDIRLIKGSRVLELVKKKEIHLLAGCPPCQGFSSVRRLNRKQSVRDKRNNLVLEYLRLVEELSPMTIMMENVPALEKYYLFQYMLEAVNALGYQCDYKIVNAADYGVPQRRKRLVLIGSRLGKIEVAPPTFEQSTVKSVIGKLSKPESSRDPLQKIHAQHSNRVQEMISLIPPNGGSRKDLPKMLWLSCHNRENVGFNDIYGRLKWESVSSTITGGCLNPSKGRFLHPEQNRALTVREALMLQSFSADYRFPTDISKTSMALLIGNALPPKLCHRLAEHIYDHICTNTSGK